ncbi:MAG: universal stress protein [Dehalococcoidia bacterium]|nr:universal stress protein [Dehalococcoidia bacterium]
MYKRVLLTLDGSALSESAIPHAAQIAAGAGAEVVVMRVVDSVAHIIAQTTPAGFEMMPGAISGDIAEQVIVAQRASAQAELDAAAGKLRAHGVANVSVEIAEGVPGTAVVETAERLGCDLVVMATHGRSGLGRAVLGSVADHVVRHAEHAAVLLVRPPHSQ